MKVIREKLTKAQVDERLRFMFKIMLSGYRRHGKKLPKKELTSKVVQCVKNCHEQWRVLAASRTLRRVYEASKKRQPVVYRKTKRNVVVFAKSLGDSNQQCPECDAKLKIWPGLFGKRHLSCSRCGWSDRVIPKDGAV